MATAPGSIRSITCALWGIARASKAARMSEPQPLSDSGIAIRAVPCIFEGTRAARAGAHSDRELHALVQTLLDAEINPNVASHGGRIAVEKVENAVLHLRMSGGCQGCAASKVTLRQGVEVMLRR